MSAVDPAKPRVLALCGGVGGAKLALGLSHVVPPEHLTIAVNTGDDFEHLGLLVSPDVDTVTYTLAGLSNTELGWGLAGETWGFMAALKRLGGEDWFNLGDHDLATHIERTRRLAAGETLSAITADIARRLGVAPKIVPMSDDPVRTVLDTDEGTLAFQRYFVGRRAEPRVTAIRYEGAETARPAPALLAALSDPALGAVIVCPSNPWLSIAPLLAIPQLRAALQACAAPIVAVSPVIAGKAVKGPTAKLMAELGLPVTAHTVAAWYGARNSAGPGLKHRGSGWLDGFLLDAEDAALTTEISELGLAVDSAPSLMQTLEHKVALARRCLEFARRLS